MQKRRPRRAPFLFGIPFTQGEYGAARPKFIFNFVEGQYGRQASRRVTIQPIQPPSNAPGRPGGEQEGGQKVDYFRRLAYELDKIKSYLLSRADRQEDAIINNAFNIIEFNAKRRIDEGADPRWVYEVYRSSAGDVEKYFLSIWDYGGHAEPLFTTMNIGGKECIAQSTPIQTASGCSRLYLCHRQGVFEARHARLPAETCKKQHEGDKKKLYTKYEEEIKKYFANLRRQAPGNEDRGIVGDIARLFSAYGEKLILGAPDVETAERNYEMLMARATRNIGNAILNAWSHKARLRRYGRGRCPYATTEFLTGASGQVSIPEAGSILMHYEFCEDSNGVLQAVARTRAKVPPRTPSKPQKPPITIPEKPAPRKPPKEQPPERQKPPIRTPERPPIRVLPIPEKPPSGPPGGSQPPRPPIRQPPEKKPPVRQPQPAPIRPPEQGPPQMPQPPGRKPPARPRPQPIPIRPPEQTPTPPRAPPQPGPQPPVRQPPGSGKPPVAIQPQPPAKKPPEEKPIRVPEEKPGKPGQKPGGSEGKVCGDYRGVRVCVDEQAGVATIGGRRYRILARVKSTSYGANEVVYDDAKIYYVKPYVPPVGSTRKCPFNASIIYVYDGKIGMPDRAYTTDNKVCHTAFNLPAKTPLSIYLVAPPEKHMSILTS